MEGKTVSDTVDQQKRTVAGGIWLVIGDIVVLWYGWALVYFIGGLILVGVCEVCQWLLGPDLGWSVGFWIVILGGAILAILGHMAWSSHELRRREAGYRRNRKD